MVEICTGAMQQFVVLHDSTAACPDLAYLLQAGVNVEGMRTLP
jgi:hypothetical protein